MRSVLGIDAAWTLTQPSGVAMAVESCGHWSLIAAASSYQRFQALADHRLQPEQCPLGSRPNADLLLASASTLGGTQVDLVSIDMPLSYSAIVGRRGCDNAVSREYGSRLCGTHSPSATRPGSLSDDLRCAFGIAGYPLLTHTVAPPGVVEVYPHPALVELAKAPTRLPYKASKVRKYWPNDSASERRVRLFQIWRKIVTLLEDRITGVAASLPEPDISASATEVKAYEDALDAIVCAWIGICVLEGRAQPFGDRSSAIWIPRG
jgi:predicted RNase H-like nuclease